MYSVTLHVILRKVMLPFRHIYSYTFVSSFDILVVCLFVVCLLAYLSAPATDPTPAFSLVSTLCSWSCFQLLDRCFQYLIQSNRLWSMHGLSPSSHYVSLGVLLQGVPHLKYSTNFGRASVPVMQSKDVCCNNRGLFSVNVCIWMSNSCVCIVIPAITLLKWIFIHFILLMFVLWITKIVMPQATILAEFRIKFKRNNSNGEQQTK